MTVKKMKTRQILPVKLIMVPVLAHFLLICFSLLSIDFQLPGTFLFSHIIFVLVGVWCCSTDNKSVYPMIMFLVVVIMTAGLDIIQLALFFNSANGDTTRGRTLRFSQGMMILSLILKPLTCVLTYLAIRIRILALPSWCECALALAGMEDDEASENQQQSE